MDSKQNLKKRVSIEMSEAQQFAKATSIDDVKSGQWFISLLSKVASTYDKNVTAEYFQKKYLGLSDDEVADILINVTVKYATIAGGVAGAAITANQIALLSSVGATAVIMAGSIGAEIIYLARLQMKLVLDLSVVYDIQLDADDPEDILMVFGYALGIVPTELIGKTIEKAAGAGTQYAIRQYISKGTLQTIQAFGKRIGMKILQRSIIKYAVPVVSAAVGSSYNYFTTKTVGKIAKAHLKNRGKVTEELRVLISKKNTYHIVFPAAVLYMAYADGKLTMEEKELYKAVLSRLTLDEFEKTEFQRLLSSQENILEAIKEINDQSISHSLVKVLALMAIYDGVFSEEEKKFLLDVSSELNIDVDIVDIERQAKDYKIIIDDNFAQKTSGAIKGFVTAIGGVISRPFKKNNKDLD